MQKPFVLGNKIVCSNEIHKKQNMQIIALCLTDDCNSKKTLCPQCFNEHDKSHIIIELSNLTSQLQEQQEFQTNQRNEKYQLLSSKQDLCYELICEKLGQIQKEANQAKQLSKQKIEAESKSHFANNLRNEEELEQLAKELQNKVNADHFNPRLIKILNQKNILLGYEKFVTKFLFDACLFLNSTDCAEQCEYFMDNQLMSLKSLMSNINDVRQEIIVGFQDEEQNLLYMQSIYEKLDQSFQLYLSKKPQQVSDEQVQYMNNLIKLPVGQILQSYPTETLITNQFQIIFDNPFSKVITKQNLNHLKTLCNEKSLICIGAIKSSDPNLLILCSIDYASELLQSTSDFKVARKSRSGSVYWYNKYGVFCGVIGFSPIQQIDIGNALNIHCDSQILEGDLRFSMQIDHKTSLRIGKDITDHPNYRWQLYLKQ
ncbi:unnamed protein product (macronuclear) [Paramecium tetraurelia]|uniref:TLDc domain-containing protein n=1 Tax=Paramecium tetraurelia TaxID=5888 RepID=A0EC29_PARTE|nr:uncharacterized protein GSPATT00025582001 [Paramecium tetraurelia]CAK92846.1 unnamed protein product [Paramecium tetraurelia]|eukprot:XP_001460243.1 hypothetical protein (macronuclear) [Paramecium tetraurelia strain d4-2]